MINPLPNSPTQPKERDEMGQPSPMQHLPSDQAWYLVHCKPNGQKMAVRNLENQKFAAFLPLQKLTRRKGKAFQTQVGPLFPGYLFVAQDPTAGQWRKINNTCAVARLVRLASEPTPVPQKIMKHLFTRCDATGVFKQSATLVAGDNAKITKGPFAGTIAKIIELKPNQRVNLLLNFMGQTSTLAVDAAGVEPIS